MVCTCRYVCIYRSVCIYACMYVYMHVCMYVCMYVCISLIVHWKPCMYNYISLIVHWKLLLKGQNHLISTVASHGHTHTHTVFCIKICMAVLYDWHNTTASLTVVSTNNNVVRFCLLLQYYFTSTYHPLLCGCDCYDNSSMAF